MSSKDVTRPIFVEPVVKHTDHALLVVWGQFAQELGLVERLEAIPISQKARDHTPQTKLIQFLVAILAGCAYLKDMNENAHPLVKDQPTAHAWGQPAWAHYSAVSRTLKACTPDVVEAVIRTFETISQPFIDREIALAVLQKGAIVLDADLTGRQVSSTARSYPDAAFGWMDDEVGLGYKAAILSLHSPTYDRLILAGFHHPGNTVATECLKELVLAAEARTGLKPRRRPELVTERMKPLTSELQTEEAQLTKRIRQTQAAQSELEAVVTQQVRLHQELIRMEAEYHARGRPERPYSKLAKLRKRFGVFTRRRQRRLRDLQKAMARVERCRGRIVPLKAQLEALSRHRQDLIDDNASGNWAPVSVVLRLDSGFGSSDKVTWLIEMGYEVYTKPYAHQAPTALRKLVTPETVWERVGCNAEMTAWVDHLVGKCPYPLDAALERFYVGDKVEYGALLHYGEHTATDDLTAWFRFYNGRQWIEAGIKEGKNVFQMKHLKVRSPAGIAIQEQFVLFAANFVRWAAVWLAQMRPQPPAPFDDPKISVKQMVCVAANTPAWVSSQPQGLLLTFTKSSPFEGVDLLLGDGWCFQPPLPLMKSVKNSR